MKRPLVLPKSSVVGDIAYNARKYWIEGEIAEILGVVALFGFLNRWNDSMGTEIEPGAKESGEQFLKEKEQFIDLRCDLNVEDCLAVELKSATEVYHVFAAQRLTYRYEIESHQGN